MNEYKLTSKFTVEKDGSKYLDVADNVVKGVVRYEYEYIEENLIRNMPDDVLEDLNCKVQNEIHRRKIV